MKGGQGVRNKIKNEDKVKIMRNNHNFSFRSQNFILLQQEH